MEEKIKELIDYIQTEIKRCNEETKEIRNKEIKLKELTYGFYKYCNLKETEGMFNAYRDVLTELESILESEE